MDGNCVGDSEGLLVGSFDGLAEGHSEGIFEFDGANDGLEDGN